MKKTDIAYTAGIIDGEGCITIGKRTSRTCRSGMRYGLSVKVSSTDEWLCQWLKLAWGGSIYLHKSKKTKWSDAWCWTIQTNMAVEFLRIILPYLNLKRPQAELALSFQEVHRRRGNYKTEAQLAIEEAQYILMKQMKGKKAKEVR